MINIKSQREIELMKIAGNIVYQTHQHIKSLIKPGASILDIDTEAEKFIISKGAKPSFKGYEGFPNATCISINEQVVHGIPSNRKLKKGDVVSIDIGADYKGYHGDSAWSYAVGEIDDNKKYIKRSTLMIPELKQRYNLALEKCVIRNMPNLKEQLIRLKSLLFV